jgi:DNA (cytosine-5)-methyltransferase 1
MGLDEVLSDLEAEGYQARCFVIPAVAADARHRRDRCWIVAHADSEGEPVSAVDEQRLERAENVGNADSGTKAKQGAGLGGEQFDGAPPREWAEKGDGVANASEDVPNADSQRLQGVWQKRDDEGSAGLRRGEAKWQKSFWQPEPSVGRVANGIPGRVHRLKQLGNSIVPQVAARILWAIKEAHNG